MTDENSPSRSASVSVQPRHYAGFWIRVVAYVIDQIILSIISQILTYTTLFLLYLFARTFQAPAPVSFGEAFSGVMIQVVNLLASFAVSIPYYIGFHHYRGATPGKQILNIVVIDERTGSFPSLPQSAGRYFASILSGVLLGAGYLMVPFNREKRALHDTLAGTVSVHREDADESPTEDVQRETPTT